MTNTKYSFLPCFGKKVTLKETRLQITQTLSNFAHRILSNKATLYSILHIKKEQLTALLLVVL
jgi:hypothetical protein